jgi:hypothetical protein
MVEKTETTRGLDTTAVLLLSALGVLAALVGATLIYFGYFAPWEFGCLCASPFWRVGPYLERAAGLSKTVSSGTQTMAAALSDGLTPRPARPASGLLLEGPSLGNSHGE